MSARQVLKAALGFRSSLVEGALLAPTTCLTASRPSIVALPFANLGEDHEQQYFADGVAEDLTTDQMFVISRNTAFTYRDKPVDTRQIGRELGVRYVLEGSVQQSGHLLRVSVRLSDAENAASLWAERFDSEMGDMFDLQNQVTRRIAVALNLELIGVEATRPSEHPDALDYIFRGRALLIARPNEIVLPWAGREPHPDFRVVDYWAQRGAARVSLGANFKVCETCIFEVGPLPPQIWISNPSIPIPGQPAYWVP